MSIGRRLIDMARSELNALLDVAARHAPDDDEDDRDGRERARDGAASSAEHLGSSAWQDESEWRRRAEQEVEDAIHGRRTPDPPPRPGQGRRGAGGGAGRSSGSSGSSVSGGNSEAARVQRAYAALELPVGSDFETVRKSYRALMRKYHPDRHTQTPEKQRAANEVAQRLTDAYKLLEKRLRK
ncbi:MAG TPA: J domain-containing protein [Polyangia bacterium]